MEYSVPGGKLNRGLTVVHTWVPLRPLALLSGQMTTSPPAPLLPHRPHLSYSLQTIKGTALTEEDAKMAAILGWCIEWVR
jgi:hypothetical protein